MDFDGRRPLLHTAAAAAGYGLRVHHAAEGHHIITGTVRKGRTINVEEQVKYAKSNISENGEELISGVFFNESKTEKVS